MHYNIRVTGFYISSAVQHEATMQHDGNMQKGAGKRNGTGKGCKNEGKGYGSTWCIQYIDIRWPLPYSIYCYMRVMPPADTGNGYQSYQKPSTYQDQGSNGSWAKRNLPWESGSSASKKGKGGGRSYSLSQTSNNNETTMSYNKRNLSRNNHEFNTK